MSGAGAAVSLPYPVAPLRPLIEEWPAGKPIERCHSPSLGPSAFNETNSPGRFRPIPKGSSVVPTLYGADGFDGALSESLFRNVPVRGPDRRVLLADLQGLVRSVLSPRRALPLAALHGYGLRRIGVTRAELIESESYCYPRTAQWGESLYESIERPVGLVWRARQHDDSYALMLFGTRVAEDDLETLQGPDALDDPATFLMVLRAAERAGITVIA